MKKFNFTDLVELTLKSDVVNSKFFGEICVQLNCVDKDSLLSSDKYNVYSFTTIAEKCKWDLAKYIIDVNTINSPLGFLIAHYLFDSIINDTKNKRMREKVYKYYLEKFNEIPFIDLTKLLIKSCTFMVFHHIGGFDSDFVYKHYVELLYKLFIYYKNDRQTIIILQNIVNKLLVSIRQLRLSDIYKLFTQIFDIQHFTVASFQISSFFMILYIGLKLMKQLINYYLQHNTLPDYPALSALLDLVQVESSTIKSNFHLFVARGQSDVLEYVEFYYFHGYNNFDFIYCPDTTIEKFLNPCRLTYLISSCVKSCINLDSYSLRSLYPSQSFRSFLDKKSSPFKNNFEIKNILQCVDISFRTALSQNYDYCSAYNLSHICWLPKYSLFKEEHE